MLCRCRSSSVICLVVLFSSAAWGQVKLEWKVIEGGSVNYETTVLMNQVMTIAGTEFKTTVDAGDTYTVTTGQWNAQGVIGQTTRLDSSRLNLTIPGAGPLLFDSTVNIAKTESPKLEPYLDVMRAVVGASYTLLVDQQGQVTGVEGVQEILGRAQAETAELLKAEFNEEKLKREFRECVEALPSQAVRTGDAWERTVTLDLGAGPVMKVERRYEYKGATVRNGRPLDEIAVADKRVAGYEIEADDEFPAQVTASELAPAEDSTGRIYFDRELGMDVETQHALHVKGKLTLMIQGMDLPAELDLKIDTQTKVKK